MSPAVTGLLAALAATTALWSASSAMAERYCGMALRRLVDRRPPPVGAQTAALRLLAVPRRWAARAWRRPAADEGLVGWLDAIARSLRSGGGLPTSLVEAATAGGGTPLEDPTRALAHAIAGGIRLDEALSDFEVETGAGGRLASRSLRLVAAAGGAPGELIDNVASTVRDRSAMEAEAWALSTQARWSAGLIAGAPIAFGLLVAVTDPRATSFLMGTPAGWACVLVGFLLDGAGLAWMARLLRRATK